MCLRSQLVVILPAPSCLSVYNGTCCTVLQLFWSLSQLLSSIISGWWSGVVVSALALINEVNHRRARLVLRWATVSGFNSRCRTLFRYVTNQPPKANSAVHPSWVGKWVPASAGKAKAGMVHFVNGWTRGVQVLWDPLRTRAIPERLRGVFTTRRYTNSRLPLPCLLKFQKALYKGRYLILYTMRSRKIPLYNILSCSKSCWFSLPATRLHR